MSSEFVGQYIKHSCLLVQLKSFWNSFNTWIHKYVDTGESRVGLEQRTFRGMFFLLFNECEKQKNKKVLLRNPTKYFCKDFSQKLKNEPVHSITTVVERGRWIPPCELLSPDSQMIRLTGSDRS